MWHTGGAEATTLGVRHPWDLILVRRSQAT